MGIGHGTDAARAAAWASSVLAIVQRGEDTVGRDLCECSDVSSVTGENNPESYSSLPETMPPRSVTASIMS